VRPHAEALKRPRLSRHRRAIAARWADVEPSAAVVARVAHAHPRPVDVAPPPAGERQVLVVDPARHAHQADGVLGVEHAGQCGADVGLVRSGQSPHPVWRRDDPRRVPELLVDALEQVQLAPALRLRLCDQRLDAHQRAAGEVGVEVGDLGLPRRRRARGIAEGRSGPDRARQRALVDDLDTGRAIIADEVHPLGADAVAAHLEHIRLAAIAVLDSRQRAGVGGQRVHGRERAGRDADLAAGLLDGELPRLTRVRRIIEADLVCPLPAGDRQQCDLRPREPGQKLCGARAKVRIVDPGRGAFGRASEPAQAVDIHGQHEWHERPFRDRRPDRRGRLRRSQARGEQSVRDEHVSLPLGRETAPLEAHASLPLCRRPHTAPHEHEGTDPLRLELSAREIRHADDRVVDGH